MAQLSTTMSHAQSATAFHYSRQSFSLSSRSPAVLSWSETNLLDLKLLFITPFGADAVGLLGGHWGVAHLNVGHAWGACDV